jgi:hypothetical protein
MKYTATSQQMKYAILSMLYSPFFVVFVNYPSARKSRADFSKVAKKESATACSHAVQISSIVS